MFKIFFSVLFFAQFLLIKSAPAATMQSYSGSALTQSLGGGGRGGGGGVALLGTHGSYLLNPALLIKYPQSVMYLGYAYKSNFKVGIVDNGRDAAFPASVQYSHSSDSQINGYTIGISAATAIKDRLGVGFSLNYEKWTRSPLGNFYDLNFDLGFVFLILKHLKFGGVMKNIYPIKTNSAEWKNESKKFRTLTLGLSYSLEKFAQVIYDVETSENLDFKHLYHIIGGETYLNEWIRFRLGYKFKNSDNQFFSAGFGFNGPQFVINYTYNQAINAPSQTSHLIDLIVPF